MASFTRLTPSRATWRQDLVAALSLLAVAGLLPILTGSCYSTGCSNHTSKGSHQAKIAVIDAGTAGYVVAGQHIERQLMISPPAAGGGPELVTIVWTPPPQAGPPSFARQTPDNPTGPPPYRFSALTVGTAEAPAILEVGYTAPGGRPAVLNDTFRVVDVATGETLHVSSFTNPYAGAQWSKHRRTGIRGQSPVPLDALQKAASSSTDAWVSQLWVYPHDPQEFTEEMCQQAFDAVTGGNGFVAVHYPISSNGSAAVPIVFLAGSEPRVALIDYTRPSDDREALSFNLDLAPQRMSWVNGNLPMSAGYGWVALEPQPSTVPQCPPGISIPEGNWEFYAETQLDYSDDADDCNGCSLELYVCFEGQDPPVSLLAGLTGLLPSITAKSVQADGVTCVGPGIVRLDDTTTSPVPGFNLTSGEGLYVESPPARVVFHHWLLNTSNPTSYNVNLQVESDLGLQWRFYSNAAATSSLSLPVSLPASSSRELWIAADIPADVNGIETVRITATATSAPDNPVWGTDFVQIGDWTPPPELEDRSIWVPVASRAEGVGGSQWRTDLGLLNPGSADAAAELRLYAGGSVREHDVTVVAGQQRILSDVVDLFGIDDSGALEIEADQNLVVTSRTYSLLAADDSCYPQGTFGQFLAGAGSATGLSAGRSGRLPQLAESASYRTNIAVTNTGDQPAAVTVVLYDAAGAEITRFDLELTPGQWRQENRVFFRRGGRADLDAASAEILVTAGAGVLAYASVVDNLTTDPTTIPLMIGGGTTTAWVPVASRAAGVGGSQWRTDLGLLNAGSERADVTVRYHSGGSTSEFQVFVAAGLQRITEDVVSRFATSGSGSIEVLSTQPIIVTSRTYSLLGTADPCYPNGTFGQFLAGQASSAGLATGEIGRLPQLQENDAYRTNLALTNTGSQDANATVVLLDAAGAEITRFDLELAPGEWKQENRVFYRRGDRADLAAASARIEVTAGSGVLAYASVVDNVTSDPTTIPLQL